MRCPRCDLVPPDPVPSCTGCGFTLSGLEGAPERSSTVVDAAEALSEPGRARIAGRLTAFTRASSHDAVVVTVASTAPLKPAEYAFELFERWKVGGEHKDGLMILLAVAEQRVECVLGAAMGLAIPDDAASALLAAHASPHLARGDVDAGVFHGTDVLTRVFEHTEGLR